MGQIVPYRREARRPTVRLAAAVKVGSFEPGGFGQGGDRGTSPHLHPTVETHLLWCHVASLGHEVGPPRVLSFQEVGNHSEVCSVSHTGLSNAQQPREPGEHRATVGNQKRLPRGHSI